MESKQPSTEKLVHVPRHYGDHGPVISSPFLPLLLQLRPVLLPLALTPKFLPEKSSKHSEAHPYKQGIWDKGSLPRLLDRHRSKMLLRHPEIQWEFQDIECDTRRLHSDVLRRTRSGASEFEILAWELSDRPRAWTVRTAKFLQLSGQKGHLGLLSSSPWNI